MEETRNNDLSKNLVESYKKEHSLHQKCDYGCLYHCTEGFRLSTPKCCFNILKVKE